MNKRFENKMMMLKAVLKLLKSNRSLWEDSNPFVNAMNQLEELIAVIDATRLITDEDHTGLVAEKTALQNSLITKAFEIVSMLHAMASSTKNKILLGKVSFPISELQRQRDRELATTCKGIALIARDNLPSLGGYPISESELVDFDEQISVYESDLPNHRVSVSERKAANAKLKDLYKEADDVLTSQIDRLMFRFSTAKPDFYAAYLNARKIVDYGTRYEKPEDDETDSNQPGD
jgi:hypothetical protein